MHFNSSFAFTITTFLFFILNISCLSAQTTITLDETDIEFYASDANFSPFVTTPLTAEAVVVSDGVDTDSDGCSPLMNDLTGKIAIIDRGNCRFDDKSIHAQNAGAIAVIICNRDDSFVIMAGDDEKGVTIPAIALPLSNCNTLRSHTGTITLVADNLFCARAIPVTVGNYSVDSIYQDPVFGNDSGAGTTEDNENIDAAKWYSFTPDTDGILEVHSCLGGGDTRLLLLESDCTTLNKDVIKLHAINDDACPFDEENPNQAFASSVTRYVYANRTYLIEWNNRWLPPNQGFSFTVDFTPTEFTPTAGQSACTATTVSSGTHTINQLDGFGAEITNGIGARWYKFSVPERQQMSLSSCNNDDAVDTHFTIYTGICDQLFPVLTDDEAATCAPLSDMKPIVIEPNRMYFIEWSDIHSSNGFNWDLVIEDIDYIPVTFNLDLRLQTTPVADVFVEESFNIFEETALSNNGDNTWSVTIEMPSFSTYEYLFIIDGQIEDLGGQNCISPNNRRIFTTENEPVSLNLVCFNSCLRCIPTECQEPIPLIDDNFDEYNLGAIGPQSPDWTTWSGNEGGVEEGIVSAEQANSGDLSLKIDGSGSQDVFLPLFDFTTGHYYIAWNMFIPTDKSAYYGMQHFTEVGREYGYDVYFNPDETGRFRVGNIDYPFTFPQEQWFKVVQIIDLDNDIASLNIAGVVVKTWRFSQQTTSTTGTNQLGGLNYFWLDANSEYYLDDVLVQQIPTATTGNYCQTATAIDEGTIQVTANENCYGGYLHIRDNLEESGKSANWYSYVPPADGVLNVNSCNNEIDTRVWLLRTNSCTDYVVVGANDDGCGADEFEPFASEREAVVEAGQQYFIVWDNVWSGNAFRFNLSFSPIEPRLGEFPQSAILVEEGSYFISTITGKSTVADQVLRSAHETLTLFGKSKWYKYEPTTDHDIEISSCENTRHDTKVFIHTGEPNSILNTTLYASANGGCGLSDFGAAQTEALAVTAGETYYIEWVRTREEDNQPFAWTLTKMNEALAIDALDFRAEYTKEGVVINWQVPPEMAAESFTIQRSTNAEDWQNIYQVKADNREGYNYLDVDVVNGLSKQTTFFYRLKTITPTATIIYSSIVNIKLASEFHWQVVPNPTRDIVNLTIGNLTTETTLEIFDARGISVKQIVLSNDAEQEIQLNLSAQPKGIYWLRLKGADRQSIKRVILH